MSRSVVFWPLLAASAIVATVYVAFRMSVPAEHRSGRAEGIVTDYAAASAEIDTDRLRATVETLSRFSSRMTGYPGASAAASFLRGEFVQMGFERVDSTGFWVPGGKARQTSERFSVVVPIDEGARIEIADSTGTVRSIPLYGLWPNLARTSSVAPEGIAGPLVYAGVGTPGAFNGLPVENSLILLDFNSGQNWLTAASLGARAVVFVEPEETDRGEAEKKFLSVPADIPRFWVGRMDGALLKSLAASGKTALIFSRMTWATRTAENVYAFLPGTDPAVADEVVVLEAYYDAMSVVPALAPGADQTSGIAGLLELARFLKTHPLKRPVIFMASAGHGQALAGAKHFVKTHLRHSGAALKVALFIGLDLSSGSQRVGFFYKGYFYDQTQRYLQPWVSPLGRQATALAEETAQAVGLVSDALFVDGINPSKGRPWQSYVPGFIALDSEPVMLSGTPGLSFTTIEDARPRLDTPFDTPDRVRIENVVRQMQTLICVLPNLLNTSGPYLTKRLTDLWTTLYGRAVEFDVSANVVPDKPVPGVFATVMPRFGARTLMGVRTLPIALADKEGRFEIDGLPAVRGVSRERATVEMAVYAVDTATGAIRYAPDRGEQGAGSFPILVRMISARREATVVLFRCVPMNLLELVDQRYYTPFVQTSLYDAGTNGTPFIYGYAYPTTGSMDTFLPAMTLFGAPGSRLRATMSSGMAGRQLLLLNAREDDPDGAGFRFETESPDAPPYLPFQTASDIWQLDESRIREFARHGISNRQVDRLHAAARNYLDRAQNALKDRHYDVYTAAAKAAWSLESRAYPDVLDTVQDAILGVLFYLTLLVPFAYCTERLVFSARRIERRIAGTTGIFMAVFLVLQTVHPAFSITFTPLVVLLAFLIIAMASAVIVIVTMKFEARMSRLKIDREGRHDDDVSRTGAMTTAAALGIANMRHRPFRTLLTCITLTLLTFSVMSFTSVNRYLRLNEVVFGNDLPPYQGLLLRHRTWEPLAEEAFAVLGNEFGKRGPVAPRAWHYAARIGDQSYVDLRHPDTDSLFVATALVGLSPQETTLRPGLTDCLVAGRWLTESDRAGVVLPAGAAAKLGIPARLDRPTEILVGGRPMPVVGIFDPEKLDRLADLDGERLTPVDFVQMSERRKQGPPDPEEFEEYVHLSTRNVALLPYGYVMNAGGRLYSVAMGLEDAKQVTETLDLLMPRTALTLFAGTGERVLLYSTIGATAVGGLSELFIPMMIAALIVMNTMLGSVYERGREIGVFNAVGLAPGHVSALFVAEAAVYAVLGVVCGYLLGQSASSVLVRSGLLPGFELNVSSLAAVGASLLVVAVVLLSTVYPARLASRMAMPAAEMGWRLPEPVDDRLDISLPFTVTGAHARGLNMFLKEWLTAHTEVAVGDFSCEDVRLAPDTGNIALSCVAWLTPYDLGVSQHVALYTTATDDPGIFSLDVRIDRISGDRQSWFRLNRPFLNLLRRQFLLWRTLGHTGQTLYNERFYHQVTR
ncbi:MAG: M28 family peptidase [candidate division Zixibacteria bacterium]|nr:M28 family peptidase [candidate division Zixibacteria bacterium]